MQWSPDDNMSGCRTRLRGEYFTPPESPAEVLYGEYFEDPAVRYNMNRIATGAIRQAELMGIDTSDPELMGAFLINLVKKVKGAIQKRRAKRKAKGTTTIPTVSVQVPGRGAAKIGPGGVTWTGAPGPAAATTAEGAETTGGGISDLMKNPMIMGAAIGVPLLLIMMKKKGGKK